MSCWEEDLWRDKVSEDKALVACATIQSPEPRDNIRRLFNKRGNARKCGECEVM